MRACSVFGAGSTCIPPHVRPSRARACLTPLRGRALCLRLRWALGVSLP